MCDAGGLGFLAAAYLAVDATAERIAATRELTGRPFGVNVFVPGSGPADPEGYRAYAERIGKWARPRGYEVGEARWDDDDYAAKVELLVRDPVAVASFTFGCPDAGTIERLRAAGSEVWVTVTSRDEAAEAVAAGADALVVQGAEAGGHRGSFADREDVPLLGLVPLMELVRSETDLPLVASGGIATAEALAAALAAGAAAAQIGTAFMLCPEAGTSPAHRAAIGSDRDTALTRAFTGRLARGIRNEFMDAHDAAAPIAYPELHNLTAPLRRAAREAGDGEAINLGPGRRTRSRARSPRPTSSAG